VITNHRCKKVQLKTFCWILYKSKINFGMMIIIIFDSFRIICLCNWFKSQLEYKRSLNFVRVMCKPNLTDADFLNLSCIHTNKKKSHITSAFKTTQPPHTKLTACNICNGLPSSKQNLCILSVLFRRIVFQINFNQSLITNECFRSN